MTISKICIRDVDLSKADETVQVAAERMNSRNVGTLVVTDEDRTPIGIVTDRDIVVRGTAQGKDPTQMTVDEVMTSTPRTILEGTSIEEALAIMRGGPHRRLPVVNRNGKLVGLLSVDDVLDLLVEEFNLVGTLLARENPMVTGRS